ncbi:hypothetical protein IJT10_03390, partial [bacterium]|nr:hypothetical protein [bacterium]
TNITRCGLPIISIPSGIKDKNADPISTPEESETTGNKIFFKALSFRSKIPAATTEVAHISIPASVI